MTSSGPGVPGVPRGREDACLPADDAVAHRLRRIDARFALAALPRTASVVGSVEGWADVLAMTGVDIVAPGRPVDLAVAGGPDAARALCLPAAEVFVEGRVARRAAPGRVLRRGIVSGPLDAPAVIVDPAGRSGAAFMARRLVTGGTRRREIRNDVFGRLALRGLLPAKVTDFTIAGSSGGRPALLELAAASGTGEVADWCLTLSGWPGSRCAFLLFPPGEHRPDRVLKFAREPGWDHLFEEDEAGLALVAHLGGSLAAHATAFLGGGETSGHRVLVETAAPGVPLSDAIRARPHRGGALVDAVATWIARVGSETADHPRALDAARRRFEAEAVRHPGRAPAARAALDALGDVPAVFGHGDLWGGHVFVEDDDFTVIDWNSARRHAFPLWDLVHFGVNVLGVLEGVKGDAGQASFVHELFLGTRPASARFFRWLRDYVTSVGLQPADVGALVTLYWLDRLFWVAGEGAEFGPPGWTSVAGESWLRDPALGVGWDLWR